MYFQSKENHKDKYLVFTNSVPTSSANKCAFSVHAWNASRGTGMNVLNASAIVTNKSISAVFKCSDLTAIVTLWHQVCSVIT